MSYKRGREGAPKTERQASIEEKTAIMATGGSELKENCAACGKPAEGNFSIHRDGFCEGPEVAICDGCGADETPTLAELWEMIAKRRDDWPVRRGY